MTILHIAVFVFCLIGCGFTSFRLGRQEGIENTVQYMIDQGVLQVEEE